MANAPSEPSAQSHDERWRLFIAIPLPHSIIEEIDRLQEKLKKGIQFTPCRPTWVKAQTLHLTLRFLGATPPEQVEHLAAGLEPIAGRYSAFTLSARDLDVFPNWRRPRVLWLGLNEPSKRLAALQSEIESLAVASGFEPDAKQFNPHLTLARFKSMKGIEAARGVVRSHQHFRTAAFPGSEVVLYRSQLLPEGPLHTALHRFALIAEGENLRL